MRFVFRPALLVALALPVLAGCLPMFMPGNVQAVAGSLGRMGPGAQASPFGGEPLVIEEHPSPPSSPTGGTRINGASTQEVRLYELINAYRRENGLEPLPLSRSLSVVARAHVADLLENAPHHQAPCNMHSWSAEGAWTPVCYTGRIEEASGMLDKPKELTGYTGHGFEIVFGAARGATGAFVTPENALDGWKTSPSHDDVVRNRGPWQDVRWRAMGLALNDRYAAVWFGKEVDLAADKP